MKPGIDKHVFGQLRDGRQVDLFHLVNRHGMCAKITNYGGIVVSLEVPDRAGRLGNVVLGFDSLAPYETDSPYFGALIGRYGNRIANAEFTLDGRRYSLDRNDNNNCLHGGFTGFDKAVWQASLCEFEGEPALQLHHLSPDGEGGFPGNLAVTVVYCLTEDNQLITHFTALSDTDTHVNFTQHSYFNLAGTGNIYQHRLHLNADYFLPLNTQHIPTGEKRKVADSVFDFRREKNLGDDIRRAEQQLQLVNGGYDHNYVLNKHYAGSFDLAARVYEPHSGRLLELLTTEPGIQFYTGNYLDGRLTASGAAQPQSGAAAFSKHSAFCLEPQHFPDSPNQPGFPSTLLKAEQPYESRMSFKFSVDHP